MTLRDLLLQVTEPEVLNALGAAYPEDKLGPYEGLIGRLLAIEPAPADGMTIVIQWRDDQPGYYDVSGDDGSPHLYAIEYTPWDRWLAMEVRVEDADLTPAQIVAHCLWEMTWAGFEPETIAERKDEIDTVARELEAALDTLPETPTTEDYEAIGLTLFNPEDKP